MALDKLTIINNGGLSTTSDYRVGVLTATKFVGPIESDSATFTGSVSIGGTLTYEDVTNIDSVGIITARDGIDCNGDLDVDGHTNLDNLSVAGVTTITGILYTASSVRINTTDDQALRLNSTDNGPVYMRFDRSGSRKAWFGFGNADNNLAIRNEISDGDLYLSVTDGGSAKNAMHIDSSENAKVNILQDLDVDGHTNLDNLSVAGVTTFSNNVHLLDNDNLYIGGSAGTTDGIRIFHNGSTSYITDNGTGDLVINSVDGNLQLRVNDTESAIKCIENGAVELYHNNLKKLSTNTTGIEIHANESNNANIYMTADEGDDNGDEWILQSQASTNNFNFYNNTSGSSALKLSIKPDGEVGFYGDLVIPANITHQGDTNTKIRFPVNDNISFETAGTERFRIDSSGRILIGHTVASADLHGPQHTTNRNPYVQLHGANCVNAGAALISWKNSAGAYYAPALFLAHSGSDTIGTNGILPAGGEFGSIIFSGDDGTDFVKGAMIKAKLDGTPGNDDMPGRLEFHTTPDGAQVPVERLRITSAGKIGINESSPDSILSVMNPTNLGTTAGDLQEILRLEGHVTNDGILDFKNVRLSNGNTWTTSTFRIQRQIDATKFGHIDFGTGSGGAGRDIQFGNGSGTIMMHLDNTGNVGINTTSESILGMSRYLSVSARNITDGGSAIEIVGNRTGSDQTLGVINFVNDASNVAQITAQYQGSTTNGSLQFFTSGDERLRITSDGKMGLGATSPNADFHIKSTFPAIRFEDDSDYSQIDANGGSLRLLADAGDTSSNSNIQFSVDGTERLRIDSNGNITHTGVTGNSSPRFTIKHSNADVEGEVVRIARTDLPTIRYHSIKAKNGGSATNNYISFNLHNGTSASGHTAQEEVLRLVGNNKVGINTTNPNHTLHVFGQGTTLAIFGDEDSGSYEALGISNAESGYPAITQESSPDTLDLRSYGSVQATIDANNNSTGKYFRVMTNGAGNAGTELLRVSDDGNVGIGEDNPSYRLQVQSDGTSTTAAGNIVARFQSNGSGRDATIQLSDNVAHSATISMLSSDLIFKQAGAETFRIASNGNVSINNDLDVDGHTNLDNVSIAGVTTFTQGTQGTATLDVRNTGGAGSGTNTGAIIAEFKGDSDALRIRNIGGGDYGIYNSQQINGIEIYDGTGGVRILYNGNIGVEFDNGNNYGDFKGVPTVNGTNLVRASDTIASATNADTVDSLHATSFLRSDQADTQTGGLTIIRDNSGSIPYIALDIENTGTSAGLALDCQASGGHKYEIQSGTAGQLLFYNRTNNAYAMSIDSSGDLRRGTHSGHLFWHAGNDGSGSGLDSDKLDGLHASSFLRSDANDTTTGNLTISKAGATLTIKDTDTTNSTQATLNFDDGNNQGVALKHVEHDGDLPLSGYGLILTGSASNTQFPNTGVLSLTVLGNIYAGATTVGSVSRVLTTADEGSGNGLDADTLDGQQGSYYADAASYVKEIRTDDDITARMDSGFYESSTATTAEGWPVTSNSWYHLIASTHSNTSNYYSMQIAGDFFSQNNFYIRSTNNSGTQAWSEIWTSSSDGSGSGLDADKLDGLHAGSFIRSNANDNVTGHTEWQDNYQVRLGNGADLKIYHNGSNSVIEDSGTGNLNILTSALAVKNAAGNENMIVANQNGNVELYYDNDRVFYTETRGVRFGDNTKIYENSTQNTAVLQHADIHHAIVFRGSTNDNGSTITNENTTTFREYGKFVFRTGAINAPVRMTIAQNGHIGAPSGSNIYPSSDVRLKKNVVTLDKGLDTIKSLRPVSFNWIDNYIEEEKDPLYGFIAQEVEAVDPNLTGLFAEEIKIGEDQENPDQVIADVKRVNEKFIIPILVKALQELTARVEDLESKNNS